MTSARCHVILRYMEDDKNSIQYALVPSFLKKRGSAKVSSYTARVKVNSTFGDEDLIREMANASGAKVEYLHYLESLRQSLIADAIKSGRRVSVGGMAIVPTIRGAFKTIDGEFDPSVNKLLVTGFTYGELQDVLKDVVPVNQEKGGSPLLNRIHEDDQEEDEVIVGAADLHLTGRDLGPDATAEDEGVWLADLKTDERVAVAALKDANLVEVVCSFAQLPPSGRYRLVVATRSGLGREYKVNEAGREVTVR